ncbi:uncharacterized protein LOC107981531 [Nasonia vitripennis]|uniref:Uncharacterized protein n=1 Tax=Nasonia vitripennis TaxID=7425 RepID=A0A7M7M7L3_NASVI|nr:uncharacterized protein LOC107981531 [Nasonia vitripennis]
MSVLNRLPPLPLCVKKMLFLEVGEEFYGDNNAFYATMLHTQEDGTSFKKTGIELFGSLHNFLKQIDVLLIQNRLLLLEIGASVFGTMHDFYTSLILEQDDQPSYFMQEGISLFMNRQIFLYEVCGEVTRQQHLFVFKTVRDCLYHNIPNVAILLLENLINELEN